MEKMNDETLSQKLEELYHIIKDIENELIYIDGDTNLNRRLKAIQQYPGLIGNCESKYDEIAGQLKLRAEGKDLIRFIFEWAIFDPSILIEFATFMNLAQVWSNIPGRSPKMIQVRR